MNKLDIYCFTSIARTKSFSITARELMISQQAVSSHVRSLENELGYSLFFRSTQAVELTQAGKIMLDYFIKRETLTDDFMEAFTERPDAQLFNICWSQWTGLPEPLSDIIKEFSQTYPNIQFLVNELTADELKEAFATEKIDFLFTSQYASEYIPLAWEHIPVGRQRIYLLRSGRLEYREDALEMYPFFAIPAGEKDEYTTRERAVSTCARIGFTPRDVIVCPEMGSACMNVLTRHGLTIGTSAITRGSTDNYRITATDLYADFILCSSYHTSNPWKITFKNFIVDKIKALPRNEDGEVIL